MIVFTIQYFDNYLHNRLYVKNVLKILIASWPIHIACYVQLTIQNTKYIQIFVIVYIEKQKTFSHE